MRAIHELKRNIAALNQWLRNRISFDDNIWCEIKILYWFFAVSKYESLSGSLINILIKNALDAEEIISAQVKKILTCFLYTQPFTSPPLSPHIYCTTVCLGEHGHKPQKQREIRCLLSSKQVWLLHDVSLALKGIKRFRIQGIADRLR